MGFQSSHKHPSGLGVVARGSFTSKKFKSAVRHFYEDRKHKNGLSSKIENNIQKPENYRQQQDTE